jgi:hypothetical protein
MSVFNERRGTLGRGNSAFAFSLNDLPESSMPPPLPSAPVPTLNPLSPEKRIQLKDTWSAVPQNLSELEAEQYILELVMQFPRPPTHNPAAKKSKVKVVGASPSTHRASGGMLKAIKSWGIGKSLASAAENDDS